MSSTEDKLRDFYNAEIAPLQGKVALAPAGPGADEGSYYVTRPEQARMQTDFRAALQTPEDIGAALDALWAGTALAGLGAKLAELSGCIETPEDTGTVSQLIYEMF
ncbi:MAG: hypothetical protein KDK26_08100 [Roseivivax sp.]|nr:hypothetical protein [Roseivivax sp.]